MKKFFKIRNFAVGILVVLLFGCHPLNNNKVPDELIGEWVTSEPRYADCVVKLTDGMIIFGNGPDNLSVNYIVNIKKVCNGQYILYTIYYEDSRGLKYKFPVRFGFENKKGVLRFRNQKHIAWTKRKELL
jgi:hypothetical protein